MKTLLAAAAIATATLLALGATPGLAASTAPPTDPMNLNSTPVSALTPRAAIYRKPVDLRRQHNRADKGSVQIEVEDFGRPVRK